MALESLCRMFKETQVETNLGKWTEIDPNTIGPAFFEWWAYLSEYRIPRFTWPVACSDHLIEERMPDLYIPTIFRFVKSNSSATKKVTCSLFYKLIYAGNWSLLIRSASRHQSESFGQRNISQDELKGAIRIYMTWRSSQSKNFDTLAYCAHECK